MSFDGVRLPADLTETLVALYHKAKKINPALTKDLFIESILREWLEPYRVEPANPVTKDNAILRNNLKQAINFSGKSQTQIAAEAGISRPYLGRVINWKCEPTVKIALLIAKALNYPPEKFTDLFFLEPVKQE